MMLKMLFRYLRVRSSEGSTWAGLSVLGLFLNQLTGFDLDPLMFAVSEALPAILTGNWIGALVVILPAVVAILKRDKPDGDEPPGQPAKPAQMASAMPPGARPQQPQGGSPYGPQT